MRAKMCISAVLIWSQPSTKARRETSEIFIFYNRYLDRTIIISRIREIDRDRASITASIDR